MMQHAQRDAKNAVLSTADLHGSSVSMSSRYSVVHLASAGTYIPWDIRTGYSGQATQIREGTKKAVRLTPPNNSFIFSGLTRRRSLGRRQEYTATFTHLAYE